VVQRCLHRPSPADRVARRPAALSVEEAACLPLPGLCALAALDAGKVDKGSRVLVHGGVGGVGGIAVQLASQRGAEVFATVGTSDLERARALGVSHPIDYRTQRFEDAARDMDFVFDTVGGDTLKRSWRVVKRGGVVASLHLPPQAYALAAAGLHAPLILRLLLPSTTRGAHAAAAKAGARPDLRGSRAHHARRRESGLARCRRQGPPLRGSRRGLRPPAERQGEGADRIEAVASRIPGHVDTYVKGRVMGSCSGRPMGSPLRSS